MRDWREKYDRELADLNAQIDRLNEENELLTKTLCEQEALYNQRNSVDTSIETKKHHSEDCSLETKAERIGEDEKKSSAVLLSREFEHHLILSAWNALRDELVMRGGN